MPNVFSYARTLPYLARQVHPDSQGIDKLRKNARFCFWGMLNRTTILTINELFQQKELAPILKQNPDIYERPLKPYVCVNWSRNERLQYLKDHFHFVQRLFGNKAAEVISHKGIPLFSFEDTEENRYTIKLYEGASREGSMGIKLVDAQERTLYELSCHVTGQQQNTLYIGMLQGPNENFPDRQAIIRRLTKSAFGLRTKALMVELILMLARQWGIHEVRAISNKGHIYQAWRYITSKRKSVSFNYNELWEEFGGQTVSTYLYRLPLTPPRKDPATLNKTKRKLYTKRYEWLQETEIEITRILNTLK